MSLIPPANFGFVEQDLYRSALPIQSNFSYLQTLHLKTVVYLSQDEPSSIFLEFLKEQNVKFCSVLNSDSKAASQRFSEQLALDALAIILDPDAYPILVCCTMGIHRTGAVIGCLRKLQKWGLSAIFDEFRRFYGTGKPSGIHEQFIELFDVELVPVPKGIERLPFHIPLPTTQTNNTDTPQQSTKNNAANQSTEALLPPLPSHTSSAPRVGSLPL